jgi:hypothetical protein
LSAYIMFIGTEEKQGVLDPDIVGPFEDAAAANAWLDGDVEAGWYGPCNSRVARWFDTNADLYGGYPAIHVICDANATNPGEWHDDDEAIDPTSAGYLAGAAAGERADLGDFAEQAERRAREALARKRNAE